MPLPGISAKSAGSLHCPRGRVRCGWAISLLAAPARLRHVDFCTPSSELTTLPFGLLFLVCRFLIVVTFIEDSLRIISQFGDQLWYLQT